MSIDTSLRARAHADALVRELDGEAVLLSLASGNYYSLDPMGLAVWNALTTASSVEDALVTLLDDYDVDRATLESDVQTLLETLQAEGLLELTAGKSGE